MLLRWGLIPFWAKDASIGFKTINAVSETAAEKRAFRDAMKLRRCLISADGFYQWETLGTKVKLPYNFGMAGDALFAFAGLSERGGLSGGKRHSQMLTKSRRFRRIIGL
jgi:putative SOS response-associated peptidase YedK